MKYDVAWFLLSIKGIYTKWVKKQKYRHFKSKNKLTKGGP